MGTTTLAMPFDGTASSNQTWTDWAQDQTENLVEPLYEVKDQVMQGWEWLQEFLPGNVTKYVEKTSDNVDDITGLVEDFIQKLTDIKDNTLDIVTQEKALSQEDIEARNVEENLEETKQKLEQLKDDIVQDKKEDAELDGLAGGIQRLITAARGVLTEVNGHTDLLWSKVKQMEAEVYKMNSIMADTTGEMKDVLKDLFATLNKELREASPALKEILDKAEAEAGKK